MPRTCTLITSPTTCKVTSTCCMWTGVITITMIITTWRPRPATRRRVEAPDAVRTTRRPRASSANIPAWSEGVAASRSDLKRRASSSGSGSQQSHDQQGRQRHGSCSDEVRAAQRRQGEGFGQPGTPVPRGLDPTPRQPWSPTPRRRGHARRARVRPGRWPRSALAARLAEQHPPQRCRAGPAVPGRATRLPPLPPRRRQRSRGRAGQPDATSALCRTTRPMGPPPAPSPRPPQVWASPARLSLPVSSRDEQAASGDPRADADARQHLCTTEDAYRAPLDGGYSAARPSPGTAPEAGAASTTARHTALASSALGERLVDRAAAQVGDDLLAGPHRGIGLPQRDVQPRPELGVPRWRPHGRITRSRSVGRRSRRRSPP